MLCSAIGYDASNQIEDLAVDIGRQVTSIAIGSAEGFNQADSVSLFKFDGDILNLTYTTLQPLSSGIGFCF